MPDRIFLFWKRDLKQGSFIRQYEPEGSCSPYPQEDLLHAKLAFLTANSDYIITHLMDIIDEPVQLVEKKLFNKEEWNSHILNGFGFTGVKLENLK